MPIIETRPRVLYYGTPVALLSTENEDRTFNLAPMSSSWTLGYTIVLGLGKTSKTFENLRARRELTVNLPSPELVDAVERLAPLTGKNPIPEAKRAQFRFEARKFETARLTPIPSKTVRPPRVAECPIQLEAKVANIHVLAGGDAAIIEASVETVFVHDEIALDGKHIDVDKWHPLLYVYRHYFGRGAYLGPTFRAETRSLNRVYSGSDELGTALRTRDRAAGTK